LINKIKLSTVKGKDKVKVNMKYSKALSLNKKLTEKELASMVSDIDLIIAGTEIISDFVMDKAKIIANSSQIKNLIFLRKKAVPRLSPTT
jgi:hypothetical protein